jgi:hypothetical protein
VASSSSRLGLDEPSATDSISGFPAEDVQALGVLDNAVIITEGTLAARPSSTAYGNEYCATDQTPIHFYKYTGTGWMSTASDSGWVNLSLTSGLGVVSGYWTPAARFLNGQVYLCGAIVNGSGSSVTAVATLPSSSMYPIPTQILDIGSTSGGAVQIAITNGGGIDLVSPLPQSGILYLDGVSYRAV